MANMCYNYVTCVGRTADINRLKKTLLNGIEHARVHLEATDLNVELQEGAFFDIWIGEHTPTTLQFSYESKWCPNLLDLAAVCKKHSVSAVSEYNECGVMLYGTAYISPVGEVVNREVSSEFLDLIEYNEETGLYEYDGIEYETEGDIIEEHYDNWRFLNGFDY